MSQQTAILILKYTKAVLAGFGYILLALFALGILFGPAIAWYMSDNWIIPATLYGIYLVVAVWAFYSHVATVAAGPRPKTAPPPPTASGIVQESTRTEYEKRQQERREAFARTATPPRPRTADIYTVDPPLTPWDNLSPQDKSRLAAMGISRATYNDHPFPVWP
jgi:hypothetical protein